MKKLPLLMLSMITLPSYADGILSTLNDYQGSLTTPKPVASGGSSKTAGPEVKPTADSVKSTTKKCEENDQKSLPLAYVTSLIQQKNAALDIVHDPRSGMISLTSADMIGNCSSMLEWKLNKPEIQGKPAYALEVKIKDGDECKPEGCSYKVAKVVDGEFKEYETMVFKPTLKGFEECLQKSGVIEKGKVVKGAIYNAPVSEKFPGMEYTGQLLFQSHGPTTPLVKAKYGKFEYVDGCDYYEAAHPQIRNLLTFQDAEKARLDSEANKLRECKVDEYQKLADFIDKYENYSDQLGQIRDKLILEAAKKSAANILAGKYSADDLKVIQDFERYIVTPKVELARAMYEQLGDLEGDDKKAKQEEFKKLLVEINSLNQKPFFQSAQTQKLLNDGHFEEAEAINTLQLMIENHKRLGSKVENVVITPNIASQRVSNGRQAFKETLEVEKERYEYKTGQSTGKAAYYTQLVQRMNENIKTRTANYQAEMQSEVERVQQPNGYCFKYWRNTQKCVQETLERLQLLQNQLTYLNKVDAQRASEYEAKAKEYAGLEAQGRRYVAAQNGEAVEEPQAKPQDGQSNNLAPEKRQAENQNGVYNFQFNGGNQQMNPQQMQMMAQQQAQMIPQTYQQQMYPQQYGQNMFQQQNPYQYQQPFMGQQSYPYQQNTFGYQQPGVYGFQFNGGAQNQMYGGFQQQPNMMMGGFGQTPYQSYGQYNMYGAWGR